MLSHTGESTPFLQHQSYVSLYKKAPWYRKKTFYLNLIRRSMAELLSTALFVFVAVSSYINVEMETQYTFSAEQYVRVLMSSAATRTTVDQVIMCWNDCRKGKHYTYSYTKHDLTENSYSTQRNLS